MSNFIGYPYGVNGYVSRSDERALHDAAVNNPGAWRWRWAAGEAGRVKADESFCRNAYQYIPTEAQVIAVQAAAQMRLVSERTPYQSQINTPAGMRLLQNIYANVNALWYELGRMSERGG